MRTSSSSSRRSPNRLLNSLSTADFGLLRPNLQPLALALRQVLETPNKRIDYVYFIASGLASVVASCWATTSPHSQPSFRPPGRGSGSMQLNCGKR